MKISLKEQVDALEDTVNNHRSYINVCERYGENAQYNEDVLIDMKKRLPFMEACLNSMKWLLINEKWIKSELSKKYKEN